MKLGWSLRFDLFRVRSVTRARVRVGVGSNPNPYLNAKPRNQKNRIPNCEIQANFTHPSHTVSFQVGSLFRLIGELIGYVGLRRPSVACPSVRRPHSLNLFSSESLGRLKPNFIWSLHGMGERKFVNGPGDMTKMAVMPIYGKSLKKSSYPEPKGR